MTPTVFGGCSSVVDCRRKLSVSPTVPAHKRANVSRTPATASGTGTIRTQDLDHNWTFITLNKDSSSETRGSGESGGSGRSRK